MHASNSQNVEQFCIAAHTTNNHRECEETPGEGGDDVEFGVTSTSSWPFEDQMAKLKRKLAEELRAVPKQCNPLFDELKVYVDEMGRTASNIITEKVTPEIESVVRNCSKIGQKRQVVWSAEDKEKMATIRYFTATFLVPQICS